ncbi:MAG: FkbM family methyltransferase [Gallionella sp.]
MKQVGGVWLPEHETHLVDWMMKKNQLVDGKLTYQLDKRNMALKYVKNWRTAIDVGAHCGLWSMDLANRFSELHAFEPVELHRQCWAKNVISQTAMLYPCALGEKDDMISIFTADTSSGDSWVKGAGDIPLKRLDDFDLQHVDFMKIDTEGHELFVLKGGEQTIRRCKPVIIVEQKPGHGKHFGIGDTDAVPLLQSWGAVLREDRSGDYVFSWND